MALTIGNEWNGEYEDGSIPRRGHTYAYAYTIQQDTDGYTWGLFIGGTRPILAASGNASSVEEARTAAARQAQALDERGK